MNRLSGAFFLLPIAGLAAYVLAYYDSPWIGEWNWTLDIVTGSVVLTGPATAACAVYLALQERGRTTLSESTPRGWQVPAACALAAWKWAMMVTLVTAVAAAVITGAATPGGTVSWWLLSSIPVDLLLCAGLGAVAGDRWPHLAVVVAVAVGVFGLGAYASGPWYDLLRHGSSSGSLAGLEPSVSVLSAQLVCSVGVVVVLLGSMALRGRRRTTAAALLAVGTVLFAGSSIVLDRIGTERWVVSDERATACAGEAPRVCLAPSRRTDLARTSEVMAKAARVFSDNGVQVAPTYEQDLPGGRPALESGLLLAPIGRTESGLRAGISRLTRPATCPAWFDPTQAPSQTVFDVDFLLQEWVAREAGLSAIAFSVEGERWLKEGDPQGEQRRWAQTTMAALTRCDLEDLRLPWDQGS